MKKTINFDAFAQFADAQLSKEEMKMIKGGTEPRDFEGGNPGGGGSGTGGGAGDPTLQGRCKVTEVNRNTSGNGPDKYTMVAIDENGVTRWWNGYYPDVLGSIVDCP